MDELPFVDEHTVDVAAPPEAVWEAVLAVAASSFGGRGASAFAGLLGCEETEVRGKPGSEGSTIVGFEVARSTPPHELVLEGRHRFSAYRLTFTAEPIAAARTRVRARTHARFPGPHGSVYRALVVGTRVHVLAVRRLLHAIADRAEPGPAPTSAGT